MPLPLVVVPAYHLRPAGCRGGPTAPPRCPRPTPPACAGRGCDRSSWPPPTRGRPPRSWPLLQGSSSWGAATSTPCTMARSPTRRSTGSSSTATPWSSTWPERAVELGLPMLAICRGIQVLNVALGGTLVQHLPDRPGTDRHGRPASDGAAAMHDVRIEPGSRLAAADGWCRPCCPSARRSTTRPPTGSPPGWSSPVAVPTGWSRRSRPTAPVGAGRPMAPGAHRRDRPPPAGDLRRVRRRRPGPLTRARLDRSAASPPASATTDLSLWLRADRGSAAAGACRPARRRHAAAAPAGAALPPRPPAQRPAAAAPAGAPRGPLPPRPPPAQGPLPPRPPSTARPLSPRPAIPAPAGDPRPARRSPPRPPASAGRRPRAACCLRARQSPRRRRPVPTIPAGTVACLGTAVIRLKIARITTVRMRPNPSAGELTREPTAVPDRPTARPRYRPPPGVPAGALSCLGTAVDSPQNRSNHDRANAPNPSAGELTNQRGRPGARPPDRDRPTARRPDGPTAGRRDQRPNRPGSGGISAVGAEGTEPCRRRP